MAETIVVGVLKSAVGWLWSKGRETVAKRLRDGDVFNQNLAGIITSDINDIKTNLNVMKLRDLRASINFFNEGVNSIAFDADSVDSPEPPPKRRKIDHSPSERKDDVAKFSQANAVKLSSHSKERFKKAREHAMLAKSDPTLKPEDKILATYITIMAQLLESSDDPERALHSCKWHLEQMHRVEPIIANFKTEFQGEGIGKRLSDVERRQVIWLVCLVNRLVFDIAQSLGGDRVFRDLFIWPTIEIQSKKRGKEEIDVLRDSRLDKVVHKQGLEPISVVWSFGDQSEEEEHKLKRPQCIATNTKGEFVVLDDMAIKIYDSSGGFLRCLLKDCKFEFHTVDVDTDNEGNLYLLAWETSKDHGKNMEELFEVFVFDTNGEFKNKFSLRNKSKGHKLALNSHGNHTEVLVLESGETGFHDKSDKVGVYRYKTEGAFDRQFGNGILRDAKDIVSATDGRILVLDESRGPKEKSCVLVFDAGKQHLSSIDVFPGSVAIGFHCVSEHVVIISVSEDREE
ncbi:uncharacterized protein LOC110046978, partial [Orbicella faveolata]|uniref:uncharacterized protein LOC110046978 n=1 Tax=Orbicella faveolata TaxID=48498 RepID=UPI0009E5AC0E